jgi:hypothetical protein
MERKQFLKAALSSLTLLSVTGCFTPMLYKTRPYDETALSFLVTEDGSRLVVLGEKYHYILDDISTSLKQILQSPLNLRAAVVVDLTDFYVKDNVVTGNYTLWLSDQASDEQRKSAIDAGFVTPDLRMSGRLKGVRYSGEGFPPTAQTQFARKYVVSVREQPSTVAKILLTPVTVAADGALILGGLLLFLIAGYPRY